MLKVVFFIFIIFTQSVNAEVCEPIRLDKNGKAFSVIPIHDQKKAAGCYSYMTSQLYDALRFKTNISEQKNLVFSSPLAGAAYTNRLREQSDVLIQESFYRDSFINAANSIGKFGTCNLKDFQSEYDPILLRDYLEKLQIVLDKKGLRNKKNALTWNATNLYNYIVESLNRVFVDEFEKSENLSKNKSEIERIKSELPAHQDGIDKTKEYLDYYKALLGPLKLNDGTEFSLDNTKEELENIHENITYYQNMLDGRNNSIEMAKDVLRDHESRIHINKRKSFLFKVQPSLEYFGEQFKNNRDPKTIFLDFIIKFCEKHKTPKFTKTIYHYTYDISEFPQKSRGSQFALNVSHTLKKDLPVGISWCGQGIFDTFVNRNEYTELCSDNVPHFAVIVGQRPVGDSSCEYLVRDSAGKRCFGLDPNDCVLGQYWVPLEMMIRNAPFTYVLDTEGPK